MSYKKGDKSRAICEICQKKVRTTIKDVGCLIAQCDECNSIVSIIHPKKRQKKNTNRSDNG